MFHGIHQQHKMQLQREQKIKRRQSAKVTENHHLGWHIFAKHIIRSQINIAFKDSTEKLPLSKQCDTETHWSSDWQFPSQNFPAESLMSASTTVTSTINATTNNFILSRMSMTCWYDVVCDKKLNWLLKGLKLWKGSIWKFATIILYWENATSNLNYSMFIIFIHGIFNTFIWHSKQAI